ncbi:MAG: glycosyltransferase [Candidatus Levybacteria bacterium]|nr:glycosyltransferase [Candidatus Levybacteria bacterium]
MVSVVIPAYNEEQSISDCLDSLVKQKTSLEFEVIVVNNNSTDKTVERANQYKDRLNLRIIDQPIKGRGAARKKGFNEAKGEIIFSTDADTAVSSNWIEEFTNILKTDDIVAITGACKIESLSKTANSVFNFLQPFMMRIYRIIFGHYWLSGFSFAIYKGIYVKSGGFDQSLNAQEDIDLSFKVSRLGKISFSNLRVTSSARRFDKGLFKGLFPYVNTFISFFFFKNKKVVLDDVR